MSTARPVEVHVLLLDDLLLLLQRQDERLLLKSHSRTLTPTPDGKTMLRPVLRLTSAMTREVATGERSHCMAQGKGCLFWAELPVEWGAEPSTEPGSQHSGKEVGKWVEVGRAGLGLVGFISEVGTAAGVCTEACLV